MPNYIACNWFTYFFTCNEGLLCCSWFAFSVLLQCVTYESRRLLSLFQFCFYWMCEFQVSKVFDVNSSLEKRLDTMAVSYDFVLPHDLQHQQRQKLCLVSVVSHIFGAYFSVALVCSRFCWLQSGMQQKFPISCLMQLLGNLPFLFFFVPYRLPGIGFILSCTRPVLSLDSL